MAIPLIDNTLGAGEELPSGGDKINQAITRVNQFDVLSATDIARLDTLGTMSSAQATGLVGTSGQATFASIKDTELTFGQVVLPTADGTLSGTPSLTFTNGVLGVGGDIDATGNISGNTADLGGLSISGHTISSASDIILDAVGDIYINGETIQVDKEMTTTDNIVVLNAGETGSGITAGSAGLQFDRGSAVDYQILFQESNGLFSIGEVGSLQAVATRPDSPDNKGIGVWDDSNDWYATHSNLLFDNNVLKAPDAQFSSLNKNGGIVYTDSAGKLQNSANATLDGNGNVEFGGITSKKGSSFIDITTVDAVPNSGNEWNRFSNTNFYAESYNNALSVIVGGAINERKAIIQVGHNSHSTYSNVLGDLFLNPFGGKVSVGKKSADYPLDVNGSINSVANRIGGTITIDSSRNFFGANGTFSGTLDVSGDLTAEANLFVDVNADILGTTTTNVLGVATTSTFSGVATFEDNVNIQTDKSLDFGVGNTDVDFLRVRYNEGDTLGFHWKYAGTGIGNLNGLELHTSTNQVYNVLQDGHFNVKQNLEVDKASTFGGVATFESDIEFQTKIESDNYLSGILGTGAQLNNDATGGSFFEVDNMRVRNELRSHIFKKDIVKAQNGFMFITDAAEIAETVTISGTSDTFKIVDDGTNAAFDSGTLLWAKNISDDGSLQVTGVKITVGTQKATGTTNGKDWIEYNITAVENGGTLNAGDTIVRVSGGYLMNDATTQYSPFLDVYDGVSTWSEFQNTDKLKGRFGSLEGVSNASGYGLYTQNAFLTGSLLAGDLTRAGNYLEFDGSAFTGVFDSLDFDSDTFVLTAGDMVIDSTNGIDLGNGDFWHDDGNSKFANGNVLFNADKSGEIAGGVINWDALGNLNIDGANIAVTSLPRVSDEGLVGLWRFDGSGINSANGDELNLLSSDEFVESISGKGLKRTTGSNSLIINHSLGNQITLCAWSDLAGDGNDTSSRMLIGGSVFTDGLAFLDDGNLVRYSWGASVVYSATSLKGEMHFYVARIDGDSGLAELFVDGEKVAESTNVNLTSGATLTRIAHQTTGANRTFDEIRAFDRLLTDNEIKSLYLYPSGNSGGVISADTVVATEAFFNELTSYNATINGILTVGQEIKSSTAGAYSLTDGGVSFANDILTADKDKVTLSGFTADATGLYADTYLGLFKNASKTIWSNGAIIGSPSGSDLIANYTGLIAGNKYNYFGDENGSKIFRMGDEDSYLYYDTVDKDLKIETPKFKVNPDGVSVEGALTATSLNAGGGVLTADANSVGLANFDVTASKISAGDLAITGGASPSIDLEDAIDINANSSIGFNNNLGTASTISFSGETMSPSESITRSITIGDNGNVISKVRVAVRDESANPPLPTYPGTQDYTFFISVEFQGQRISDDVWEVINYGTLIYETETYQDPRQGGDPEPSQEIYEYTSPEPIICKPSAKYDNYRVVFTNEGFDTWTFLDVEQRPISNKSILNKGGALLATSHVQNSTRYYINNNSQSYIDVVAVKTVDGTGTKARLKAVLIDEGSFVEEEILFESAYL